MLNQEIEPAVFASVSAPVRSSLTMDRFKVPTLSQRLLEELRFLRNFYGIKVRVGKPTKRDFSDISEMGKLTLGEAVAAVSIVKEEISKYPQEYLDFCRVKQIRLGRSLKYALQGLPQTLSVGGLHSAGNIYIPATDHQHLRTTIHHEMFHCADDSDIKKSAKTVLVGGMIAQIKVDLMRITWSRLNKPQTPPYIGTVAYFHLPIEERDKLSTNGFAKGYGRANPAEDRATIAETLMTNPKVLKDQIQKDPILRLKVRRVIRLFVNRSAGKMHAQYFSALFRS